jgi:chromatin remodeling complex protein RSC6
MAGKKQVKKTSAKKSMDKKSPVVEEPVVEEPVVQEPVVQEPVVQEPVVEEVVGDSSGSDSPTLPQDELLVYDWSALQSRLKSVLSLMRELSSEVTRLEKAVNRDKRVVDRRLRTKSKRTNKGGLNGFQKPGVVSSELRKFLGLNDGELIARTEVTKGIRKYCQENNLQNDADKRIILADTKLKKLLRIKKGDQLTYFNLQRYMKVHFPNKEGEFVSGVSA